MLHIISGHVDKWDNSDTVKRSARQTDIREHIVMIIWAQV